MDTLLLDFNGVIVDDEPLHYESFRAVLGEEGVALDLAAYQRDYLGIDDRAAFRKAGGWDAAEVERLVGRKAARYAELAARDLRIVPGAPDFIWYAAAFAPLAVVSGALRTEVEAGLEAAGVRDAIDVVVSAEDVGAAKPDPEGFRRALRLLSLRHGTDGWRAVIIEDSLPGLAAARALGAGCVMLTTSHAPALLGGADLVWRDFAGHHVDELGPLWREVAP